MAKFNIHSAILISHTKTTSDQNHVESVNRIISNPLFFKSLSINVLKVLIENYGLMLRSKHNNALNNLYTNLLKVR